MTKQNCNEVHPEFDVFHPEGHEVSWEEEYVKKFMNKPMSECAYNEHNKIINFIKSLLSTTRNEIIKEIEKKMEPPLSWKKAVKSYDPKTKGEYCACCGFNPDNWKSLLNSLITKYE